MNISVGVAVLVIAALVLKRDEQRAQTHLDIGGVALVSAALLLLFVPLIEGRDAGWPVWMLACLGLCVLVSYAFLMWEHDRSRRGHTPLLNVALFRQRAFSVGLGITLAFLCGNAGSAFLFALFLQVGRGFSPIQSALTFVPSAAGFFAMSLFAPGVVPLFGRHVLSLGRRLQPAADGDRRTYIRGQTRGDLRRVQADPSVKTTSYRCGSTLVARRAAACMCCWAMGSRSMASKSSRRRHWA